MFCGWQGIALQGYNDTFVDGEDFSNSENFNALLKMYVGSIYEPKHKVQKQMHCVSTLLL